MQNTEFTLPDDAFEHVGVDPEVADSMLRKSLSFWQDTWRRLKKNHFAMVGLVVLLLMILFSLFAPVFSPYDYKETYMDDYNLPPSVQHPFGTDTLGRDMWTRVWVGGRVSLAIGFIAALLQGCFGIFLGSIAGYFGGKIDMIIMRVIDVLIAIPYLVWVTLLMIVTGAGIVPMILALTLTGWLSMARLVRGQVLQLKNEEYVLSARSLGVGTRRIILKYMIPNAIGVILVNMTFSVLGAIFSEAFLSFIGIGISSPMTSWGQLVSMGMKLMSLYPYQLIWPSVFIALTMLSLQLIGDGLRDALDPKLRR